MTGLARCYGDRDQGADAWAKASPRATVARWLKQAGESGRRRRAAGGAGDRQGHGRGQRAVGRRCCPRSSSPRAPRSRSAPCSGALKRLARPPRSRRCRRPRPRASIRRGSRSARSRGRPQFPPATAAYPRRRCPAAGDGLAAGGGAAAGGGEADGGEARLPLTRSAPAPARTAASPRATCSNSSSARRRRPRRPPHRLRLRRRAKAPRPADAREERVKMTRLRRTIAARLKEAQNTAAMLTTFNEVDMSARHGAARRIQGRVREEATAASGSASCRSSCAPASPR